METLTKEFFVEKLDSFKEDFDSFRMEIEKEFDSFRTDVKKEFNSVRSEMMTKIDFDREISSIREDIESLAEMTSRSFTAMTLDFVRLEARVKNLDEKVESFVNVDYRSRIDVLRDDMHVVKTKLGIA